MQLTWWCSTSTRSSLSGQKTRKADAPRAFLEGFKGKLVCDGYQVYHTLENDAETDFILTPHLQIAGQGPLKPDEVIMGSNYSADLIGQMYFLLGKKFSQIMAIPNRGWKKAFCAVLYPAGWMLSLKYKKDKSR